jgi:hypothetical protein
VDSFFEWAVAGGLLLIAAGLFAIAQAITDWTTAWKEEGEDDRTG